MEVAIRFNAVAYVSGDSIEEIKEKWDNMPLFVDNAQIDFIDVDSVENTEDFEDVSDEFWGL